MNQPKQYEIDAVIEDAMQTKLRNGYSVNVAVNKLWLSPCKYRLGFNFKHGAKVGDVYYNDDGTKCEVIAIV